MNKKAGSLKWIVGLLTVIGLMFSLILGGGSATNQCDSENSQNADTSIQVDSKSKEENAKVIYDYVGSHIEGATPQGLVGMIANFEQESQLNPAAIERPNDPLSGHGLAQWTAGRTTNLKNFASEKGKEWSDLGLQLEFLLHELNGSEKGAVSALKVDSVEEATEQWQIKFERAGIPAMGNRLTYANKWYAKLGSSDPAAGNALSVASDGEAISSTLECGSSVGGADGDIVASARKYIGWFHYPNPIAHNLAMIGGDPRNPDKEGRTDCSGFVWLALENADYKVPPNMGWFTGSMTADARGSHQWLNEVSEGEADAGDIVIVNQGGGAGANGHTAVLAEKWRGKDTKIIQMGGNGNITNEDTFNNSFLSLLNGGDICFARPIKK
ncbi:phage tail tip lysozyme [Enterococcus sp. AZ103]|uniref:phage tail tip lysozyme n=1 Tax=Enterococcus sp. AZ103 TaxID=2774628 RepID=UPI003F1ED2F9